MVVVSQRDAQPFRERGQVSILNAMSVRRSVPGPKRRAGLVFVRTRNTPTKTACCGLSSRWALLRARPGGAPRWVVGECRSPRIAALASAEVRVLGAQNRPAPCYDRARVHRPGALCRGVPVKVIEAAAQGIPVVASAILQRQLGWQDGRDIRGVPRPLPAPLPACWTTTPMAGTTGRRLGARRITRRLCPANHRLLLGERRRRTCMNPA